MDRGISGKPSGKFYDFICYKLTTLLKEELGYDGNICADWDITTDKKWGMENKSRIERHYQCLKAGLNMFGGCNDMEILRDTFAFGKMIRQEYPNDLPMPKEFSSFAKGWSEEEKDTRSPQQQMEEIYRDSARRCLLMSFYTGLFESPYRIQAESDALLAATRVCPEAYEAQLASLVLVKNHLIEKWDGKRKKVYIPLRFAPAFDTFFASGPASIAMPFAGCEKLSDYFDVVTDGISPDADPENLKGTDIIRRTDFTGVDFAIVCADNPDSGVGYDASRVNLDPEKGPIDNGYVPISLQYRPYYAVPSTCRETAIGVDYDEELAWTAAGGAPGTSRVYAGKTVTTENERDLDLMLDTKKAIGEIPMLVYLTLSNPMCFYEFEAQADTILVGFSVSEDAALEVIAGAYEPSGLLPCQMPADMRTVEMQMEDVPFDMVCHTDTDGHIYDYAYGMNWSGVISDWRTDKYGREDL